MRLKLLGIAFVALVFTCFTFVGPAVAYAHTNANASTYHGPGSNVVVNGLHVIGTRTVANDYPCPGQRHSGVGPEPHGTCKSSTSGVHTYLNSGPSCSGSVKLLVFTGGITRFYASNSAYNVGSWVEYYWCPANGWANGLNWAKGHEYPLSGCNDLISGNGWGANMQQQYTNTIFPDGDPYQTFYGVCSGPNGYVYDFSEPADGSYNYLAWMWGGTPAGAPSSCKAQTPGYA